MSTARSWLCDEGVDGLELRMVRKYPISYCFDGLYRGWLEVEGLG